jgi:signal transduction histidine kinase
MKRIWIAHLNLRMKLMLATVTLVVLVILLVVVWVSSNMRQLIREETRVRGFIIAQLFGATNLNHFQSYDYLAIQQNANRAKAENELLYLIAYDKEGRVAANTEDPSLVALSGTALSGWRRAAAGERVFLEIDWPYQSPSRSIVPIKVFEITFPILTSGRANRWGTIQLAVSTEKMKNIIHQTQIEILQVGVFSLILGIFGALALSRRITDPVERLLREVSQASTGNLSHRIEVHSGDELEKLAESFNSMMDQIQAHQENRIRNEKMIAVGNMVNTILHDCRTPVTVIRGYASLLRDYQISKSLQKECLDFICYEVERIERMLEEILHFSQGKKPDLQLKEWSVDDFLADCGREISGLFQATSIRLSLGLHCDRLALIDRDRLGRAVLNIAANAKDAMKGKGEFSLQSHCDGSEAVIILMDDGPGVPESLKDRIFDPFFTHGKPLGIGLGMSITKKIIEEHSGRVDLESGSGMGTSFTIRLPLVQSAFQSAPLRH